MPGNQREIVIMARPIWIFFLFLLFLIGCSGEQPTPIGSKKTDRSVQYQNTEDEIQLFYFNAPPHIYMDANQKLTGAIVDFIEEGIAPEMGLKFNWSQKFTSIPRQIEIIKKDDDLSKIPVVILTNLDSEQQQANKYNVEDYLVKSDTGLDELVAVVKRHV